MRSALVLALTLFLLLPVQAPAQTIAISGVEGGNLVQEFYPPIGSVFELSVWIDPDGLGSQAVEFAYTDLPVLAPGLIQVHLNTITPIIILPSPCFEGACSFPFGQCIDPVVPLEVARIGYLDVSGVIGNDTVVSVRGLQPGDEWPSSFDGAPGFVDCDDNPVPLTRGGTTGGRTGAGVVFEAGEAVLNPTQDVVPVEPQRFSRLKARWN